MDELLPVVEFAAQEAADDDALPEGFIDFSRMDMDRVEAPSFGMVTRVVAPTSREAQSSPDAQRALANAMELLVKKEVFAGYDSAREWSSVRAEFPEARIVLPTLFWGLSTPRPPTRPSGRPA